MAGASLMVRVLVADWVWTHGAGPATAPETEAMGAAATHRRLEPAPPAL